MHTRYHLEIFLQLRQLRLNFFSGQCIISGSTSKCTEFVMEATHCQSSAAPNNRYDF